MTSSEKQRCWRKKFQIDIFQKAAEVSPSVGHTQGKKTPKEDVIGQKPPKKKTIAFFFFFSSTYFLHLFLDADNLKKIPHLLALQPLGELKIFGADLTEEGSFDAAVAGCDFVFHVATPSDFASSQDLEVLTTKHSLLKYQLAI